MAFGCLQANLSELLTSDFWSFDLFLDGVIKAWAQLVNAKDCWFLQNYFFKIVDCTYKGSYGKVSLP
jgi:hypothetical protein